MPKFKVNSSLWKSETVTLPQWVLEREKQLRKKKLKIIIHRRIIKRRTKERRNELKHM